MSSARPVGSGFSPLDDQLALLPGQFSPFLVQCIVRLGTLMPFEQVPDLLAFLTGVHVAVDTVRRLTEQAGAAQVALEMRQVEQLERELPAIPTGAAVQQVSADGAMVSLVHGAWTEVRTLAIGKLEPDGKGEGGHANDIHYFSRRCSAHDFIRQVALPFYERGTGRADTVVAVTDGADWLQQLVDAHCPNAVRILDFPHAAEYLSKAAQATFGAGSQEASEWLETWLHRLKHKTPELVLAALRALPAMTTEAIAARETAIGYLTKRLEQIRYATFQKQGYPIGSGMVESANKLVVEARLKGSGMHWAEANVTPMVTVRAITSSGRWDEAWPGIWQELRRQTADRRRAGRERRRADRAERPVPPPAPLTPIMPSRPKQVVDGHPTADHRWKRDPIVQAIPKT